MEIRPGQEEYVLLSQNCNLIPVWRKINADMDTPISIFKKLSPHGPAYLLESVEGGENLARYSFIGFDPFITLTSDGQVSLKKTSNGESKVNGNIFKVLQEITGSYKAHAMEDLPRFYGGAVGYISYDSVRLIEDVVMPPKGIPGLPDCSFIFAGTVLVFDHVMRTLAIIINSRPGNEPSNTYSEALGQIERIIKLVKKRITDNSLSYQKSTAEGTVRANLSREEFMEKVARARELIKAGDILQVVLSRRLRVPFQGDPFEVYRKLRALNPSPYMYYINLGEAAVVGSSPEMLVRVEGQLMETCPIAGTRPRGRNLQQDRELAEELLADEKERAEHLMLVDLGRNDLGRVCRTGSVEVTRFMEVERYSHVMHLVSHVRGRLLPGKNCFDALQACFPAGTVSGAPKVRAMEIISELEPDGRGIYAGAVGYFGFSGNMDTAIAIRTIVIHGDSAYIQAGAGIVADSDPAREYDETMNKARALLKTLEEAGKNAADD